MTPWQYVGYLLRELCGWALATAVFAILMFALLGMAVVQAQNHPMVEEHAWISKYVNGYGQNCCGPNDTYRLTHGEANALGVGSTVTVDSGHGHTREITIQKIYGTEDPDGLPWVTSYGCLFRAAGV